MILTSARRAIHDAYAINLTSRGFEVKHTAAVTKPDFSSYLFSVNRRLPDNRVKLLAEFKPVGFYTGDYVPGGDNNQTICNTAEAGVIISAVQSLPEPFQSWAIWAYGPQTEHFKPEQTRFFCWLENDIQNNLEAIQRKYKKPAIQKIRQVVAYTVLNYRAYLVNGTRPYPDSRIVKECRIQRQNWKKDYQSWSRYYWLRCDNYLDAKALRPVGKAVSRLIRGRENNAEKNVKK